VQPLRHQPFSAAVVSSAWLALLEALGAPLGLSEQGPLATPSEQARRVWAPASNCPIGRLCLLQR